MSDTKPHSLPDRSHLIFYDSFVYDTCCTHVEAILFAQAVNLHGIRIVPDGAPAHPQLEGSFGYHCLNEYTTLLTL